MKIILLIGVLFLSFLGTTQNVNYILKGVVENLDLKKKEGGVTVSIMKDGKLLTSAITSSNGKYGLDFEGLTKIKFDIIFSKAGLVSKKLTFNGTTMTLEGIVEGTEIPLPGDVSLFAERPGIDFSFLNSESFATLNWDNEGNSFAPDMAAYARMKKKVDDLMASKPVGSSPDEVKYQAAIKAGEGLFTQKKYQEALAKYEEASSLKPKEAVPLAKISEIDKLLKALNSEKLAGQQLDTEYKNLIAAADNLRDQKKYPEAILKYNEAVKKKDEAYPKGEVTKLNGLIADQKAKEAQFELLKKDGLALVTSKKWSEAKGKLESAIAIKPDALLSQKIKEIDGELAKESADKDKTAKYSSTMSVADGLLASGKLVEAKAKYTEASLIDTSQPVAKQKITEVANLIANQSANAVKKAKVDKLLAEGNTAFTSSNFAGAKIKFEEVLKEEADNALAKAKLQEISQKLDAQKGQAEKDAQFEALKKEGMTLATSKKYAEAKIKLESAIQIKTDVVVSQKIIEIENTLKAGQSQAALEEEYKKIMAEAASLESSKNYDGAIAKYKDAQTKKPTEVLPKSKIVELEKLKLALAKEEAAKNTADQNTKNQTALEDEFKKIMAEASSLESSKNYDGAIAKYREALTKKPTEALPKAKIIELDKLKKTVDSQNQAESQKNILYAKHMASGAKNLTDKKYDLAIVEFQNALTTKPEDSEAKNKLAEAKKIKEDLDKAISKNSDAKNELTKLITNADNVFKQERFLEAKALYEKILLVEVDNAHSIKQISECDRLEKKKGETEGAAEYKKLVGAADKKFNEKDYLKAKEYYERALGIRSTDPYPKKRLEEIEALLNPKAKADVIVSTDTKTLIDAEKLQPLGAPYDKSIVDGKDDLKKAEIARLIARDKELNSGIQNVNDKAGALNTQKHQEHLSTTKDIFDFNTNIENQNNSKDAGHQDVIELNKKVNKEQQDFNDNAITIEDKDHLNNQDKIDAVGKEIDAEYEVKNVVFVTKGDVLNKQNTDFAAKNEIQNQKFDSKNVASKQDLLDVEQTIIDRVKDDKESRKAVEERIESTIAKTVQKNEDLTNSKKNEVLNSKIQIDNSEKKMNDKIENDLASSLDISIDIRAIKKVIQESADKSNDHKTEQSNIAISQIVDLNKKITEQSLVNEDNLQNSTESLKKANKILRDNLNDEYNNEMVKYLASKTNLNEKISKVNESMGASNDKLIEHNGVIKDMATSLSDENGKQMQDQIDKNLISQQSIHDKKNVGDVKKPVIANSLGQEYEEGVTEESFTQNDENGLMKAIVTRRVVVIEKKGDVYVRTQTLSSITYSKNGSPSSERVWQKETQGPNLVKHTK